MKNYFKYFITTSVAILITVALLLLLIMDTHAQGNNPQIQKAPDNVSVDGSIKEWGDSLALYDEKTKLNYAIADNDSDLYVAISAADRQVIHKIMAGGITVSVNPDGKKSKKYNLTYPIPDKNAIFTRPTADNDDSQELNRPPSLIQSTSIKVSGFKDVESDVITTANTYGFKAAVKFDDKHNLGYEIAIPLKFLYLKSNKANELAINISINGMEKPKKDGRPEGGGMEGIGGSGGGGFGGGGGRMGGGGRRGGRLGGGSQDQQNKSDMNQSEDFWVKLTLPAIKQ
ncbi:hypothetical protein KXQ82_10625 [Mucilaginibacter sp. HMF5004]|uniref:hypothetical protein n=1 Tax=Mucilaginibacter rivuli TaxID=2857527 RepID=UPI001C5DA1FE|nr:hypothetical protein [Mucilaginibacter rivuli]MBW4890174.1 hypothetical protein [Mucilaginibacter rivuli]